MGQQWPKSGGFEFNTSGTLQTGCLVYFYEAGTSTPLATYQDGDETTTHEHPVEMSGNRWPLIFVPYGSYKYVIKTSGGTTLFTADDVPNPEPEDPAIGVDANAIFQTGDMIFVGKNGTRSGFVRCNGRTIGNATSGGTERAHADTATLFSYLWDNYANGQAAVSGGRGATAAADYAANKTIALPDLRGAKLIGFDDMGNSAASLLGSAPVVSGSGILAGSILGANTHTILEAQLPAHTHTVSITSGAGSAHTHGTGTFATVGNGAHTHTATTETESAQHTHTVGPGQPSTTNGQFAGAGGTGWGGTTGTNTTGNPSATHTHSINTTSDPGNHTHTFTGSLATESLHTHLVSGSTGSIGSGTAHNILSRAIPVTVLMKL